MPSSPQRKFFYGWILLPLCLTNTLISNGISSSFSVIFVSLLAEFGLSRADLSGIYSLYIFVFFCGGALAGALLDRLGPRILIPGGALLAGVGLYACGKVSSPYQLYLFYGLITAMGTCCISWIPNSVIISNWFVRGRGLAMGIVMCGNGLGMLTFIPLTQYLIEWIGWRGTFAVLAVIPLLSVAPLNALFQRARPDEREALGYGREAGKEAKFRGVGQTIPGAPRLWTLADAIRDQSFWMMCLAGFCNPLVTFSLTLHQVAFVVERGFEPMKVASALGLMGIFAMVGRVSGGTLSDRVGREWSYSIFVGFAAMAIFSLFFLNPERSWILSFYIVLAGLGMGVGGAMFPPMLADLFPGPSLGKILGITSLFAGLGSGFGSWFVGYLYDATGSYAWGLACLISAVGAAVTFVWIAAPRKRRWGGFTGPGKIS